MSALLILTTLSQKWMHAITSVPNLWSHIQICRSDEDSLALIDTFAHLSGQMPLHLDIYVQLYDESSIITSIFEKARDRICKITIFNDGPRTGDDGTVTTEVYQIFKSVCLLPRAIYIDMSSLNDGPNLQQLARFVGDGSNSHTLRPAYHSRFEQKEINAMKGFFLQLDELHISTPIDFVIPRLQTFVTIRRLAIVGPDQQTEAPPESELESVAKMYQCGGIRICSGL